ncbi:MAG: molecular chaperone HtpG [Candidatus Marinamargulisbacteria bacterium]
MAKAKTTGQLSINTTNILPIIKKWLYSDHDIFIRELVSNACDAITKHQKLSQLQDDISFDADPEITVKTDKKKKTVTISDNGLGMTREEVENYITQIAFSGAEDFVKKYESEDKDAGIIGHFGLGFYSSFMVASTVEIQTLSCTPNAKPVYWRCDGDTDYTLDKGTRTSVGTDIILTISDDSETFLEEATIETLLKKYANFLPVTIHLNDKKAVTHGAPLWETSPQDVSDDDYKAFYNTLFPMSGEPLFWVHLNVDYPFNLKGIIYFPKIMHELDTSKSRIQLFCQNVFVSDNVNNILPEFLTLLQGAIDCPELPLNVSRSALQNDPYVQKISNHIVKKVGDELSKRFKQSFDTFKSDWKDIHPFIKFGMMNNDTFYKKTEKITLLTDANDTVAVLSDVADTAKKDHDGKIVYAQSKNQVVAHQSFFKEKNIPVFIFDSAIDNHFIQFIESKYDGASFISIDNALKEFSVSKNNDEIVDADTNKTPSEILPDIFKSALNNDNITFEAKPLDVSSPAIIYEDEMMKRFGQMNQFMRQGMPELPKKFTCVLNSGSPVLKQIIALNKNGKTDRVTTICQHVYDLAVLSNQPLEGDQLEQFLNRSLSLLNETIQ